MGSNRSGALLFSVLEESVQDEHRVLNQFIFDLWLEVHSFQHSSHPCKALISEFLINLVYFTLNQLAGRPVNLSDKLGDQSFERVVLLLATFSEKLPN